MTTEGRLQKHYNEKYANEDAGRVGSVRIHSRPNDRFEAVVFAALSKPGGSLLDIGAGSGNVLLTLAPHFEKCAGTEIAQKRVSELQRLFSLRGISNVDIQHHNAETEGFPYSDAYFDVVILNAIIDNLIDPIVVLQKVHRILKPGGRVVICCANFAKWTRRIKLLFGRFPSTASLDEGLLNYDRTTPTDLYDEGHLHYFTFRSLGRICTERAGFRSVQKIGFGNGPLPRLLPNLFSDILIVATK